MSAPRPQERPLPQGTPPPQDPPLPQGDEKVRAVIAMFDAIAPRYDLVNRIMTMGLDVGWRRRTVASLGLAGGAQVVDLACGTGDLCIALRRVGLRPVGVDMSAGMLAASRGRGPVPSQNGIALIRADACHLPFGDACFDGATCGFALRNLADLGLFLSEAARVLRPGARIALLEVAEPPNPLLRWGHHTYFSKVVPRIGGALSNGAAYRYLPRSVAYLPEPDALVAMVARAGFPDAERRLLTGGIAQLLVGTRR